MVYKARLPNSFQKETKKLPGNIKSKVIKEIKTILEDPYCGIALVGNLKGLWKRRMGKYRIVYQILNDKEFVIFHSVDLRKKIYK
ncbi:MAG: type II toxin-antitoxin system RelE/ParE family toxin [Methanosarcinaceae archaeon]|nr:type II toxin-antitoxin system RelE/ParE family toxin [Methanosarcinaceae archaeon]